MIKFFSPQTVLKFIKYWPPFLAARISVEDINEDFTKINVKMTQNKFNTNYVGTHFGGSLYSMCDPFFMFILLHHLRDEHVVWDQSAKIDFLKPGKGTVQAKFEISLGEIEKLKEQAKNNFNLRPSFKCDVIDEKNNIVAQVEKQLYIRRKDAKERFAKN